MVQSSLRRPIREAIMKPLTLAAAFAFLVGGPVAGQAQPLRPDLVVSNISVTPQRVGVGEEFTYTMTVKNIGGAPCNWLTFQLFGADDLSELVRVVPDVPINCDREICSGGPLFLLWPGHSIEAKFVQRAVRPGLHGAAAGTVDRGNICIESSETNNTGLSPTVQIIERPKLSLSVRRPPRTNIEQTLEVYTAIVTNVGRGVATDVAFVFPQGQGFAPVELLSARFGPPPAGGSPPPPVLPLTGPCSTSPDGRTKLCTVAVRLGPNESFHASIRSEGCRPLSRNPQPVSVATADDISTDNHGAVLQRSCLTGVTP